MRARWTSLMLAAFLSGNAAEVFGQADADRLRTAKTLFFDRKYEEARQAWEAIHGEARGDDAVAAAYWVARCSENLGEHDRAFREYEEFLAQRPTDKALAEEARTSRVGLATKLYRAGKTRHLSVLRDALADPSKTVRYYAALQMGTLGPSVGRPAVPVLVRIVREEDDPDLVERAKVMLLRLAPEALPRDEPREPRGVGRGTKPGQVTMIKVRIYGKGHARPEVSVNLPVAFAEMVFKSLPDEAKRDLRRKGYEPETFWEKLRTLEPMQILEITGDDGERVRIWLE